jgi:membrane-bound acyltransferase YfiQ involved in biofilm formation
MDVDDPLAAPLQQERTMSFAIYLVGFLLLTGGVAWGLVTAGVPTLYVAIACVILVGLGIISGVSKTRSKDPSS